MVVVVIFEMKFELLGGGYHQNQRMSIRQDVHEI